MSCPFVSNTLCTWWGVSTSRCCPKVSLETFTNRVVAITTHKQLGQPKVTWSNRLRKTQLALGCPPTSESTVLKLSRSPRSPPGGDSPSVCCPYLGGGSWGPFPALPLTSPGYFPPMLRLLLLTPQSPPISPLPSFPWGSLGPEGRPGVLAGAPPPGDPSPCGGENGARKRKFYF